MYDDFNEDFIEEELQVSKEQDHEGTSLDSNTFLCPISEISLPSVISVNYKMKLKEAISLMQKRKVGSLVIIDDKDELVGIFTERDVLMRVIGIIANWEETPLSDVMTATPQTLQKGDEIAYVLNNMHVGGYRHIPIVDENDRPISMVSIKDVVRWVLDHFPKEITNLTGEPYRGVKSREGA